MSKQICDHFEAEPVGAVIGHQLADGRWRFSQRYFCDRCDRFFTESHDQDLERRAHPRPTGAISQRIDRVHGTLRELRAGMDALRQTLDPSEGPKTPA